MTEQAGGGYMIDGAVIELTDLIFERDKQLEELRAELEKKEDKIKFWVESWNKLDKENAELKAAKEDLLKMVKDLSSLMLMSSQKTAEKFLEKIKKYQ